MGHSVAGWWLSPTPPKNMSQMGLLFPIYGQIKAMFQTTNQVIMWLYVVIMQ